MQLLGFNSMYLPLHVTGFGHCNAFMIQWFLPLPGVSGWEYFLNSPSFITSISLIWFFDPILHVLFTIQWFPLPWGKGMRIFFEFPSFITFISLIYVINPILHVIHDLVIFPSPGGKGMRIFFEFPSFITFISLIWFIDPLHVLFTI
jgi:hypothetical protein